jgi:uncharacterized membrane protein YphA (DoxX/SURF4 family)
VVLRLGLGLVFVVAGALKGMHPRDAALSIGAFQLTGPWLSMFGGIVFPGVEVLAGASLVSGWMVRGASLVTAGFSLMFAVVVASVMVRGLDLECGCFGHFAISPRAGPVTLGFDLVLLASSGIVFLGSRDRDRLGSAASTAALSDRA